jgi:hypothetical protein
MTNITTKLGLYIKSHFIGIVTLYLLLGSSFTSHGEGVLSLDAVPNTVHISTYLSIRLPSFWSLLQFQLGPHCRMRNEQPLGLTSHKLNIQHYNIPPTSSKLPLDDSAFVTLTCPKLNSGFGSPIDKTFITKFTMILFCCKRKGGSNVTKLLGSSGLHL